MSIFGALHRLHLSGPSCESGNLHYNVALEPFRLKAKEVADTDFRLSAFIGFTLLLVTLALLTAVQSGNHWAPPSDTKSRSDLEVIGVAALVWVWYLLSLTAAICLRSATERGAKAPLALREAKCWKANSILGRLGTLLLVAALVGVIMTKSRSLGGGIIGSLVLCFGTLAYLWFTQTQYKLVAEYTTELDSLEESGSSIV